MKLVPLLGKIRRPEPATVIAKKPEIKKTQKMLVAEDREPREIKIEERLAKVRAVNPKARPEIPPSKPLGGWAFTGGSSTPGGGGAEVLTRIAPGPAVGTNSFVVGGIPKPAGGTGPGLGGSGSAPGVGGPGKEPGMLSNEESARPEPKVERIAQPPKPASEPPKPKEEPPKAEPKKEEPPTPEPPKVEKKREIDPQEIAAFKRLIERKIEQSKRYPAQARLAGIEGRVKLSFQIRQDRYPENTKVVESSKHQILDNAAVETVNVAAPYLPFPKSVDEPAIRVTITVNFKLR